MPKPIQYWLRVASRSMILHRSIWAPFNPLQAPPFNPPPRLPQAPSPPLPSPTSFLLSPLYGLFAFVLRSPLSPAYPSRSSGFAIFYLPAAYTRPLSRLPYLSAVCLSKYRKGKSQKRKNQKKSRNQKKNQYGLPRSPCCRSLAPKQKPCLAHIRPVADTTAPRLLTSGFRVGCTPTALKNVSDLTGALPFRTRPATPGAPPQPTGTSALTNVSDPTGALPFRTPSATPEAPPRPTGTSASAQRNPRSRASGPRSPSFSANFSAVVKPYSCVTHFGSAFFSSFLAGGRGAQI